MSSRQRFQLSHAGPDGSWKTDGFTCSANQVSLLLLPPSIWWPALAAPHRKPAGKLSSVMPSANETDATSGTSGRRYLPSEVGPSEVGPSEVGRQRSATS